MTIQRRRTFTPEFKLEAAQLVVEQNYSIREAASAMNIGKSSMDKWVRQLRSELNGTAGVETPFQMGVLTFRHICLDFSLTFEGHLRVTLS